MEDSLEDEVLYQTYISHMKLMSKFAVALPLNLAPLNYVWRIFRIYMLKPEFLAFSLILFLLFFYLQALDAWSRSLFNRIQCSFGVSPTRVARLQFLNSGGGDELSWDLKGKNAAAYAIQGRRPHMEDRYVIFENIADSDVSLFAIYDGHGGDFAADFAKNNLSENIKTRVNQILDYQKTNPVNENSLKAHDEDNEPKASIERKPSERTTSRERPVLKAAERKESFKGRTSSTDDVKGKLTDPFLLNLLRDRKGVTRDVTPNSSGNKVYSPSHPSVYLSRDNKKIDFGKLLTDEVLKADEMLLQQAKKNYDVAGSTALLAIIEGSKLIVANVGDSRGVMCDFKGNAIPLSFDHKPQQRKERQRITQAGGFVTFNGVWRVAGILATSRALGDYPLKDKNLIVAEPDILTFDLIDHRPQFVILATDGLWDAFSNEEAVAFIKDRLNEPFYGAKSITLQAYHKGSLDNISVIIINFNDNQWSKK